MIGSGHRGARRSLLVLAGGMFLLSACAHVNQDELDRELTDLRGELQEEIRTGDEAVEQRVGEVDDRVTQLESQLTALENDLNALRDEFGATVERLESAIRFNAPIHFAFDDDTVQPSDRELLEQFAQVVGQHYDGATVTVEGFTDPAGSPDYNQRLGERRAEAVKSYLVQQGLAEDRLRAVSYGEANERQVVPGAQGPGQDGWQNRRVAMVIDFRGDMSGPAEVAENSNETEGR